jgi:hypothetical protein
LLAAGLASSRADGASSRADGSVRALRGWPCLQAPPLDGPDLQGYHRSVEPSPKRRHYWSAAIRGVPGMLEVFSTGIKLFAPSGALACSSVRGSPLRGSPLRAARFRANLTQAALAPAFPKPMVSEPMVSEPMVSAPVGRKRPTRRAFYAQSLLRVLYPARGLEAGPTYASRRALVSRRLSAPARPLRPRPRLRGWLHPPLPTYSTRQHPLLHITQTSMLAPSASPSLSHLQPAHRPACARRLGA